MKTIYLAGGCYWGMQHFLQLICGVESTEVGFANGNTKNPTYEQVYTDKTGYAETVKVVLNPSVLPLSDLIRLYFKAINPLSLNQQGEDQGTRYRTGIYFSNPADEPVIRQIYDEIQQQYAEPLAVELLPLQNFVPADEYHQDYLIKNPNGYCHLTKDIFDVARNYRRPSIS